MRKPEPDSNDGEAYDKTHLFWGEKDWHNYLVNADQEVARFLVAYQQLKDRPNHLEVIARFLRAENTEYLMVTQSEVPIDNEALENVMQALEGFLNQVRKPEGLPYTIHRHLGFVMTRGLFVFLYKAWEVMMKHAGGLIAAKQAWDYACYLHQGEYHSTMAFNAMDVGDVSLAICHFKRALESFNDSMRCVQTIPRDASFKWLGLLRKDLCLALFDLREIWLHALKSCRDEAAGLDASAMDDTDEDDSED